MLKNRLCMSEQILRAVCIPSLQHTCVQVYFSFSQTHSRLCALTLTQALALSGQKVFGIPIIVQMTMAEKNRLAAQAQNLMKKEGPKKLYIGSLHYNITENIIKSIFEPFGHIEKLQIMRDEAGLSKGFGFIEVSTSARVLRQ